MDLEKEVEKNNKRNKKFIKEFEKWLKKDNLTDKVINKHLQNIDLYLNDYLNYYEVTKMEDGVSKAYSFLNDWFIRKCLWSSKTSIKENAASIKKFYKCMNELGYITTDAYQLVYDEITNNMDEFYDSLEEYDNFDLEITEEGLW